FYAEFRGAPASMSAVRNRPASIMCSYSVVLVRNTTHLETRMRTHLVFAHPERHSFCGAMMDAACDELHALGHDVVVSDLYADGFDAVGGPGDFTAPIGGVPFHYQSEQRHAHRTGGFAPDIAREQDRV